MIKAPRRVLAVIKYHQNVWLYYGYLPPSNGKNGMKDGMYVSWTKDL